MRWTRVSCGSPFSYAGLEERIPLRHSLRKTRREVNEALASLGAECEAFHTDFGRSSTPPERPIRTTLLQMLFSVRFERQLMELKGFNLMRG